MSCCGSRYFPRVLILTALGTIPACLSAQLPRTSQDQTAMQVNGQLASVEVLLTGPDGKPFQHPAVVRLVRVNGQLEDEETSKGGRARLDHVAAAEYELQVVAPGYTTKVQRIDLKALSSSKFSIQMERSEEGIDSISEHEMSVLGPKGEKALGKAIESIRRKKFSDAKVALEKANAIAPTSAEVQYLLAVNEQSQNNIEAARTYVKKAVELDPQHYRSLVFLGEQLLHEGQTADSLKYLEGAVKADPTAWRPHALYAEAYLRQGSNNEAIQEAQRAQDLGHARAAGVVPILAAAMRNQGQTAEATALLQKYVDEHATDDAAKSLLVSFSKNDEPVSVQKKVVRTASQSIASETPTELIPSNWLPPDVDESDGSLEPGVTCDTDAVLKSAGKRVQEFVQNVDRFTAIESVENVPINKWGLAEVGVHRRFEYLVGIREESPGRFNVEEFRTATTHENEYVDGVATHGLPALLLIIHPHNVGNFEVACEGRVRWSGGEAWQLHFRQRTDKPNTIRQYKIGLKGQAYAVNLKGRVWVDASTYQVVRLESQMIAPIPAIKLTVDDSVIEYGPVNFKAKKVSMWLPKVAEVYSERGSKRFHQSHTFSNYALFSVDEKQKISEPVQKAETEMIPQEAGAKPN